MTSEVGRIAKSLLDDVVPSRELLNAMDNENAEFAIGTKVSEVRQLRAILEMLAAARQQQAQDCPNCLQPAWCRVHGCVQPASQAPAAEPAGERAAFEVRERALYVAKELNANYGSALCCEASDLLRTMARSLPVPADSALTAAASAMAAKLVMRAETDVTGMFTARGIMETEASQLLRKLAAPPALSAAQPEQEFVAPLLYVRMRYGGVDWEENCVCDLGPNARADMMAGCAPEDGYSCIPAFAHPAPDASAIRAQRFQHQKGGTYLVRFEGLLEASKERMVVYQSEADGQVWIRPASEFYDGRFSALAADNPKGK